MKLYTNELLLLLSLLAAGFQDESLKVLWGDQLESTIDVIQTMVADENSRLDVIQSRINEITPTFLNSGSGSSITLSTAGHYQLEENITANITINGSNISLDLNNYSVTGILIIFSSNVHVYNGYIMAPAPTSGTTYAVYLGNSSAVRSILSNLVIICADSGGTAVRGRRGIQIDGSYMQVLNCVIMSGSASAGNGSTTTGVAGGEGIHVRSASYYTILKNCVIATGNGGSAPGTGGTGGDGGTGIFCERSDYTDIVGCRILSTGNGGDGDGGSGTGGAGGTGILLGGASTYLGARDCVIANTGLGGSGATPGADGKGMLNQVTGTSTRSIALRNKAHNVSGLKFDLNNVGTEQGVQINPYPPNSTAINAYANTYVS